MFRFLGYRFGRRPRKGAANRLLEDFWIGSFYKEEPGRLDRLGRLRLPTDVHARCFTKEKPERQHTRYFGR
jgi:hypothetical protein